MTSLGSASAIVITSLIVLVPACKTTPKAGERCGAEDTPTCGSPDSLLVCKDFKWRPVPCRGPEGCSGTSGRCDMTTAKVGEPCLAEAYASPEQACSEDKKEALTCDNGVFAAARPCGGPKGCTIVSGTPVCDPMISEVGAPCRRAGDGIGACSGDRKAVLECVDLPAGTRARGHVNGTFALARACPTKNGCKIGALEPERTIPIAVCDFAEADVDTPCGKGHENIAICSPDKRSIIKCDPTSLTFKTEMKCAAAQSCQPYEKYANNVVCR